MDNLLIQKVYSDVKGVLNTIYKQRKRTLFFQKIMWIITGLYFVLMLLNMGTTYFYNSENSLIVFFRQFQATESNPYAYMYPIIGLIVLLYPTAYIFAKAFQKYKIKETETISKMVKMLFPKVGFTQQVVAPVKEITNSKLFSWVKTDTPIYSYGQIIGKANEKTMNIADIGIVEDNVSNKFIGILMRIPILNIFVILYQFILKNVLTNKTADNVYFTFRGMFCWLSFKKKLNGHTIILTNNQKTKLDRASSFKFTNEQKIHLEDPRFTDQFLVYSTDQVEAHYVLSVALMERIVTLKEKFSQPILLSFQNQQMYLAVENSNGLFSFPSGKLDTIKIIEELANDIETGLKITSELKLE